MRISWLTGLAMALWCGRGVGGAAVTCRMNAAAGSPRRSVAEVVADLDAVPVFAIATAGKLYSFDNGGCMIYTGLADATRVLAQLQSTYPEEAFEVQPLSLGTVLSESGWLVKRDAPPMATLVASADAKRAARELRAAGHASACDDILNSAVPKRWQPLTTVPIFHIGALQTRATSAGTQGSGPDAADSTWPLFFQTGDIDELWTQLGAPGAERPPVHVIDLATLLVGLREPSAAPGTPLVCAPLDALEFVAEQSRKLREDLACAALDASDSPEE